LLPLHFHVHAVDFFDCCSSEFSWKFKEHKWKWNSLIYFLCRCKNIQKHFHFFINIIAIGSASKACGLMEQYYEWKMRSLAIDQNSFDLNFFVHFFTSGNCACLMSCWGNFSFPKSHNFQFHSHRVSAEYSFKVKRKKNFFFKKKEGKFYVAMMMMMDCLQEAFHHCMHVRLTAFECSCFCCFCSFLMHENREINFKIFTFLCWNLLKIFWEFLRKF
jgi:hypothetical protein